MSLNSIVINSEEDAWTVLEKMVDGQMQDCFVEFKSWPTINLKIKGERYSSTVPANLLDRLSNIQRNLNTFYGKFVYDGDARNLKKAEKHEIELVYSVQKGSTDIKADATGLLNKLGESMNNPGTQVVTAVTLCVIALSIAGTISITNAADNNKEVELQRLKILEKAIEVAPSLEGVPNSLKRTFNRIISSVSDAQSITFGTRTLNQNEIRKVAKEAHENIEIVQISGRYKINSIRNYAQYYLLEILYDNNVNIRARLSKNLVKSHQMDLILKSLTSEILVPLTFKAKKIDDDLSSVNVQSIDDA